MAKTIPTTEGVHWRSDGKGGHVMPEKQSDYLDWLLTPPAERIPDTKQKWADLNDVHVDTLKRWKRDERFRAEWKRRSEEQLTSTERLKDVTDTLYQAAKNGDVKAATAYLAYVAQYMPPPKPPTDEADTRGMSDAELAAQARELADALDG